MPVAPVDEDHLAPAGKYKIRTSGQITAMQAETIPKTMGQAAHGHLRLGVLGADAPHHTGPRLAIDDVHRPPELPQARPLPGRSPNWNPERDVAPHPRSPLMFRWWGSALVRTIPNLFALHSRERTEGELARACHASDSAGWRDFASFASARANPSRAPRTLGQMSGNSETSSRLCDVRSGVRGQCPSPSSSPGRPSKK